jgi:hypothetical protein
MYGPELVAYEFSSAGPIEAPRLSKRVATARRRASITKRITRATSLPAFIEMFAVMFGASSAKRQAVHRESRAKIGRRVRVGKTRMTLSALMVKSRCNNHVSGGIRCEASIRQTAELIWRLATLLTTPKTTYAACRVFASVFIGATMDIMTRGMNGKDGREYIPKLELAVMHRLPPEAFKALGISCRHISSVSREIRERVSTSTNPAWTAAAKAIKPTC